MERTQGELYLGSYLDESGTPTEERVRYDATDLTTHGVIVGMTGSGKTGLGIVAIEEALLSGVPVLILDPKGDMTNLDLVFPELRGADFAPWVNEGDAQRAGQSIEEFAAGQAQLWTSGLERSGLGARDLAALRQAAEVVVYTPGSEAAAQLNIVGNLSAPASGADPEALREEAATLVTGLLALVGIEADPLASREHVLLANLVERAWAEGRSLDLATLVAQVVEPPVRKLGVFEVDTFFPPDDRRKLALRLNGLIASPSFAAWTQGAPLDIERLLYDEDRKPRASVVYLAHLSDAERQFVVGLVLAKLITWMRRQAGTTDLRALVYMDEMFGFAPPNAEPPSKRAILTLLKQARAFGVGMLLSTQNPVDLDYKAMSNAGTWMIGRLQTERDKARVLEGLSAVGGSADPGQLDRLISALGARQFVLHNTHERGGPRLFTTRWAMSYLRGPLTREQLGRLEGASVASRFAERTTSEATGVAAPAGTPAAARDDVTGLAPSVAAGVPVYFGDPAAEWVAALGGRAGAPLEPALVARVHVLYDDTKADLVHREEWEAILHPLDAQADAGAFTAVDYDPRDLLGTAPEGAAFTLVEAPIAEPAYFRRVEGELKARLARELSLEILANTGLKLYSRVGESTEDFAKRCDEAAQQRADAEAATLRKRYESKMDQVRNAMTRIEDRIGQLETDTSTRRTNELLGAASDLLGSFFGGKKSTRSIATGAGRVIRGASSRRGVTARASQRLDTAREQLEDEQADLAELEEELAAELEEINDRWEAVAREVTTVDVGVEKTDITVEEVALAWLPIGR